MHTLAIATLSHDCEYNYGSIIYVAIVWPTATGQPNSNLFVKHREVAGNSKWITAIIIGTGSSSFHSHLRRRTVHELASYVSNLSFVSMYWWCNIIIIFLCPISYMLLHNASSEISYKKTIGLEILKIDWVWVSSLFWAKISMTPIITVTVLTLVSIHLTSVQTLLEHKNIPPVILSHEDGNSSCPSEQQRVCSLKVKVERTLGLQPPDPHQCGAGEWIRIAYLNMTDPSQTCPQAWTEINDTTNGVRVCGRPPSSHDMCHGTFYFTGGLTFTKVCGRVIGYQIGHPDAFHHFNSINSAYVEGVSITHGFPTRSHIWTYAADTSETRNHLACPCDNGSSSSPPSFVGNNYYCESGNQNSNSINYFLYADDPLWDGEGCSTEGTCCSDIDGQFPPWFTVPLNNPTNDSIEVRICADFDTSEDTPIELLEIYIQWEIIIWTIPYN